MRLRFIFKKEKRINSNVRHEGVDFKFVKKYNLNGRAEMFSTSEAQQKIAGLSCIWGE
jgi:hypothetical protein